MGYVIRIHGWLMRDQIGLQGPGMVDEGRDRSTGSRERGW